MALTTGIVDERWRRNPGLRSTGDVAPLPAPATEVASVEPGRFTYKGTPGQFKRTSGGGNEVQAFTRAVLAGKDLGAPTSYGGQAPLRPEELAQSEARVGQGQQDFANPIHVIKGMTSLYQGPQAGEVFAAPGQANQAFRRDSGANFVPAGGPLAGQIHQQRLDEIAAQGKSQEATMAGNLMTSKKNLESFMNRVQSDPRFYKEGPEGMTPVVPGLGQMLLGFKAMGEADPEKAWQAFEAKAARHLDETKWVNDQGVLKVIENLGRQGFVLTPGQKAWLSTPQTDPEAEKKRRDTILQWVNPAAIPGGQPPTVQPNPGASSLQERAGQDKLVPMSARQPSVSATPTAAPTTAPPAASAFLLRPDQIGRLNEGSQNEELKKKLSNLSADLEKRLYR